MLFSEKSRQYFREDLRLYARVVRFHVCGALGHVGWRERDSSRCCLQRGIEADEMENGVPS